MRKSNNLLHTIKASSHNHGEDQRLPIQLMASETHHSNGILNQKLLLKDKRETLVTVESMRKSTDLLQLIKVSFPNHGDGLRRPIHKTDSKMPDGNGLILIVQRLKEPL